MNHEAVSLRQSLRRVGAGEGVAHIVAGAALFTLLARAFEHQVALAVPLSCGVVWAGWYSALRAARVREWFGAWDAVSFLFVAAYAIGLSATAVWFLR